MRPSGLLRLPEDLSDLVDLGQQLVGLAGVHLALGAARSGQLRGLVDQGVELRVLLEVRRLEVVDPQHPQVVLDELGALFLDQDRAGPEVVIVVVGHLGDDRLDRLGLDPSLGRVVDAARQVAVRRDVDGGCEQLREHRGPLVSGVREGHSPGTLLRVPRLSGPGSYPLPHHPFGLARVHGPSMLPTLRAGDRLLVRYAGPVTTGRLVLARFADGTLPVKRAVEARETRTGDPGWWLLSDN